MISGMRIGGREFGPGLIERIQATVDAEPGISRRRLSLQVCEWLDWHAPNGHPQEVSCRKALAELGRRGLVRLPALPRVYGFQQASPPVPAAGPEPARVACSLAELGPVELVAVSGRGSPEGRLWNALMERFHPLGPGPLCGEQVRYLVCSERAGPLGALSFSAATWRLAERDRWIGWSDPARRAHLREVVSNSRFLIAPTVEVPNLGSWVLARALERLPDDWEARYAVRPVLAETFVDPDRFAGTTYRAANWLCIGRTAARPGGFENGKRPSGRKDIYVRALRPDWKERLCAEPPAPLGSGRRPERPADWAEEEFGGAPWYDERLGRRLLGLARDFYAQPGQPVSVACGGMEAKVKAAYRFFGNGQVDLGSVLRSHIEASVARVREHAVVLAVQDTTSLNYSAHPATDGLGPINTKADGATGFLVHDTMAFTPEGTPLGLLDLQCWARDPGEAGKAEQRKELPIEQKESAKWLRSYRAVAEAGRLCPGTMLVSVGDREADLYELFAEAEATPGGPKLLVRAERTRQRQTDEAALWATLERAAVAGTIEVRISAKGARAARTARVAVRHAPVTLRPPKDKPLPPVRLWAVLAREEGAPPGVKEPLEWMLLTTVETATFEAACERVRWYTRRWGIEVYHRTLKSGCRIEDRRLGDAASLEACLAIDLVVAWRIHQLTQAGRETPEASCRQYLSEEEVTVLAAWATGRRPGEQPPTLRQAVRWLGQLGGFRGRKSDGEPGTTCLWRGLRRLSDLVTGFRLGAAAHPRGSGP
jgi:hypothetical protein